MGVPPAPTRMGYVPKPPPKTKIRHVAPPISVVDESTFDAWMALPVDDQRTLAEFAANPVVHEFTWEWVFPAHLFQAPSTRVGPPGIQPSRPWPRS